MGAKKEEKKDILKVRNSRKVYIPVYLMVLALAGVVGYVKYNDQPLNTLALILAGLFVFFSLKSTEVHRFNNSYEIKPPSLIHTKGIFNKTSKRVDLFAISDADVHQTLWQRMLNFGDVNVRLFSKDSTTYIKNINNPSLFAESLERKMLEIRRGGGGGGLK